MSSMINKIKDKDSIKCEVCGKEIPKWHDKYCNRLCQKRGLLNKMLEAKKERE